MLSRLCLLHLVVSVSGAAASAPRVTPSVGPFLTQATQKILARDTLPPPPASSFQVDAARNEYEPILVVLTGGRSYTAVNVTVTGVSVQYRTYRVGYVDVVNISDCDSRGPGQYPDPLIPDVDSYFGQTRNALPVTVPIGENRQLLVDLFVPPDAKPGLYQGAVAVSSDAQGLVTLPFNLQVFAHTLPSTASMQSDYGMSKKSIAAGHHMSATDLDSPAQQQLYKRYLDAGLMYRISGGSSMQTALGFADFEEQYDSFVNKTGRDLPFGMRGARLTAVRLPCNTLGDGDGSHHGCPVFVATNSSWANASVAWTKSVTRYWAAVYANFSRHGDGREQVSLSLIFSAPCSKLAACTVLHQIENLLFQCFDCCVCLA